MLISGCNTGNIYDCPNTDIGKDFISAETGAELRAVIGSRGCFIKAEIFVTARIGFNRMSECLGHIRDTCENPC